jgi:hypothetical protein
MPAPRLERISGRAALVTVRKRSALVMKRRPIGATTAVQRLVRLSAVATGLFVALFVLGVVPAAKSSVVPAATSGVSLKVQDRSHDNDNPDNTLYALYQIVNTGTTAVPMSELTMRYWFTNASATDTPVFSCDWAQVSCSNITSSIVTLNPARTKADHYVQLSFSAGAGSIQPGQTSGEIQTRVHDINWSMFNTTNTYSFISDPSFVYKDTQTVTLYLNGALIWGTEPA